MKNLETIIGLEIHVQLKTKSKMFCCCDNQSFAEATDGKQAEAIKPNTLVCPVCLGLPGALPVANKQAIEWTIKTGIALNSGIPKIAKFDRKHYFYPDLPKGYQISQYDEPFAINGELKVKSEKLKGEEEITIRFNRIHLEEDAGKLIHQNGVSLIDLNRAGTPLMEIVTEPDITSPKMAGDFLRRLQKLVRDEVGVSDADMEKGHLRCDANISVYDGEVESGKWKVKSMSEIVEIKNLNSFRFVEKALALEEARLKAEYPNWPAKKTKVTRGYDSKKNITFVQRTKEEAADYRYFPEPDLPPIETSKFNIEKLRSEIGKSLEARLDNLLLDAIAESDAGVLVSDPIKESVYKTILKHTTKENAPISARAIVHHYFSFDFTPEDEEKAPEYANGIDALARGEISKAQFSEITKLIHEESHDTFEAALKATGGGRIGSEEELGRTIDQVLVENSKEVERYQAGKKQLFGFFMGQVMKATGGRADAKLVNEILQKKLTDF